MIKETITLLYPLTKISLADPGNKEKETDKSNVKEHTEGACEMPLTDPKPNYNWQYQVHFEEIAN